MDLATILPGRHGDGSGVAISQAVLNRILLEFPPIDEHGQAQMNVPQPKLTRAGFLEALLGLPQGSVADFPGILPGFVDPNDEVYQNLEAYMGTEGESDEGETM